MRRAVEERVTGVEVQLDVRHKPPLARLREPAATREVAEHDDVAAVCEHQLEIAPPQRAAGPPAVLDHPVLGDRLDGGAADGGRQGRGTDLHLGRLRLRQAAHAHSEPSWSTGYGA